MSDSIPLTPPCKHVLKGLLKLSDNSTFPLVYNTSMARFHRFDKAEPYFDVTRYIGEIDTIMMLLFDEGYLVRPFEEDKFTCSLTQKALHWKYLAAIRIRDFLISSILVPILVSFLTTIVTLWITAAL